MAARVERLRFAAETVGLFLVAIGSVVLAAVELGPLWFVLTVAAAALVGVWLVAATKLRQLWLIRAKELRDYGPAGPSTTSAIEQQAIENAGWRKCLRGAFAQTPPWPPMPTSGASGPDGPDARLQPRHIAELHARDARLEDAHIPPKIARDVEFIKQQPGWVVHVHGDAVIATSPDGRSAQVSRSLVADSKVGLLHHQLWLRDLEWLGLEVRRGARGQMHVGAGGERHLQDPPVG
ncbi:MAG: hypothetical protein M3Y17_13910 [Actinomycetota bacterium]|nr:hypothetical protein [Actinomycetota bacterium]